MPASVSTVNIVEEMKRIRRELKRIADCMEDRKTASGPESENRR
jgi:hypothetical protein